MRRHSQGPDLRIHTLVADKSMAAFGRILEMNVNAGERGDKRILVNAAVFPYHAMFHRIQGHSPVQCPRIEIQEREFFGNQFREGTFAC